MKSIILTLVLIVVLGFSFACSTAKNTGEAVKEGTEEVAQEVGDKTEDVAEEVGDKTEKKQLKMLVKKSKMEALQPPSK
jgi:Tfp pilus assembly protein PilO